VIDISAEVASGELYRALTRCRKILSTVEEVAH
jgi:hypothetical protein